MCSRELLSNAAVPAAEQKAPAANIRVTIVGGAAQISHVNSCGISSKQSTSAAINRRMRDPKFTSLDAPAAS
jgi:hypothetical protein